jgi:hypothetical protein
VKGTEAEVAAYVQQFMKQYQWALERFFRGTVTSVTGSAGNYLVQIQRTNEAKPDGGTYLCAINGYTPTVGDKVECIWRDQITAYVLWKLPA